MATATCTLHPTTPEPHTLVAIGQESESVSKILLVGRGGYLCALARDLRAAVAFRLANPQATAEAKPLCIAAGLRLSRRNAARATNRQGQALGDDAAPSAIDQKRGGNAAAGYSE